MTRAQSFLFLLVLLSGTAVVLRAVSQRARVPYVVVLAAGGILVGLVPGVPSSSVSSDLILLAFVPGLVFEATLTLNLTQLRAVVLPVTLLATAGVALTVTAIGALTHAQLGLAWPDALLLGAILAPTDPIAVVGVLRRLGAPPRLAAVLEGESLFNDGTGIAVFAAVLASISSGSPTAGDVLLRFVEATAGGVAVGAAAGAVGVLLLRGIREPQLEILVSLTIAYGSYLAGDLAHVSGIVSVVTAGIVVAATGRRRRLHGRELTDFWSVLAFLLNAILFLLIGTAVPTRRLLDSADIVLLAFLILTVSRAVPVYALLAAVDPRARLVSWRERHVVFWAGVRGALSVALALSVAHNPRIDQRVSTLAYGAVLLSLLLQGGTIRLVARWVGLDRAEPG